MKTMKRIRIPKNKYPPSLRRQSCGRELELPPIAQSDF